MKKRFSLFLGAFLLHPPAFAESPIQIGVSLSDLGNPFFITLAEQVELAAKRVGGKQMRVAVVSSAYDLQRQIRQIEEFTSQPVQLIILNAADPVAIEPAVDKAKDKGIKVIAVDVNATGADITITTDNIMAGKMACEALAKKMKGKGSMAILNGPPVSSIIERTTGCLQAIAHFPHIKVVSKDKNGGGSKEGGVAKMTELLANYPDLDGLFTINDPTAIGAEMVIKQMGKKRIPIYSVDGAPTIEERLKDPTSMIEGSATQSPQMMAKLSVEAGLHLIKGKAPSKRIILIPPTLITKQNIASYKGWGKR